MIHRLLTFILPILIGAAAFGQSGPAKATLIDCFTTGCNGNYFFDASLDTFDARFTVEFNNDITDWTWIDGHGTPQFSITAIELSDYAIPQLSLNGVVIHVNDLSGFMAIVSDGSWEFKDDFGDEIFGTYEATLNVPEPSSSLLFATGLIGLVGLSRRRRRK